MITVNVKADVQGTIDYLNRLKQGLGDQVIVVALNETTAQAKTQMSRNIRSVYNIDASTVRDKLQTKRARRAGQDFTAELLAGDQRAKFSFNVIRFLQSKQTLRAWKKSQAKGSRFSQPQLQFQIRRGTSQQIPGTFVATAHGGTAVFRRVGQSRYPIESVQTVGVPQMFERPTIENPVVAFMRDKFAEVFERRFRYFASTAR